MSGLALFAETPRAGQLGHRFLTGLGLSATEHEIAAFVQVAEDDVTVGENFVAVGRNVPQKATGGTVREGREVIVLAGIDVKRTSPDSLQQILESLQRHLGNLESLIQGGIDWSCVRQSEVVIQRKELAEWLNELQAIPVSNTNWSHGPQLLSTNPTVATSSLSIGGQPNRTTMLAIFLCVLGVGLVAGFLVGVRYARGSYTSSVDSPPGDPRPQGPIGANPPAPEPGDTVTKPSDCGPEISAGVGEMILAAARTDDTSTLPDLLSLLPRDAKIPSPIVDEVLDQCGRLLKLDQFDDSLRLADATLALGNTFTQDSERSALLADLQRKAQEGCTSLEKEDRRLYEIIQELSGSRQAAAAGEYLESGPRQYMSQQVKRWLVWAHGAVSVELVGIEFPQDGPYNIRFAANDREIGFRYETLAGVAASPPLALKLSHLEITTLKLPCSLTVSAEHTEAALNPQQIEFQGELQLDRGGTPTRTVSLRSAGPQCRSGRITIRILTQGEMPDLPKWTKDK
ncbi:MAG: hypothetical protein O2931_09930 [Planctomycetota bacterium]|nr:hypothetical protein [Planctomycetota bacterium]